MKIVSDIENYKEDTPSLLTIGTFDGVHIGHQKIIRNLVSQAKEKGHLAVVLTFFPHPRMVLQKDSSIRLIDTLEEKQKDTCLLRDRHPCDSSFFKRIL